MNVDPARLEKLRSRPYDGQAVKRLKLGAKAPALGRWKAMVQTKLRKLLSAWRREKKREDIGAPRRLTGCAPASAASLMTASARVALVLCEC